jgi:hypothetical protein
LDIIPSWVRNAPAFLALAPWPPFSLFAAELEASPSGWLWIAKLGL